MAATALELSLNVNGASHPVVFEARRLVCFGWVGRDQKALQAHVDELAELGVPRPTQVPIRMDLSPSLLTSDSEITVVSDQSSGEIEYVLLCGRDTTWVTVGSDQTDRDIETKSIPASKQMCAKVIARTCWPYDEVAAHWDQLMLRCWVVHEGKRSLYQEGSLASILSPPELLGKLWNLTDVPDGGVVVFSGTIATTSGLVYGDAYELELEDPVLARKIRASYQVKLLPQHL